jgi:hypothetical protein
VAGGETLLHLDSSTFEIDVKNLLLEFKCFYEDNQPHSVKRLLDRLIKLSKTPF